MTSSYFDNIQDVLTKRVALSQHSICIAVAWFTNDIIFESLKSALNKKVKVKVVILNDLINRNEFGLDFGILTKLGAEVRFAKSDNGTMHNKFCIIDKVVITGSYNWTYHANKNDENILITDEESVVDRYREEFDRLFGAATPIPLPYEHLKWTDVKEGDFSELRRNIFRDVMAKSDENCELKRIKLINLDHAYKSGDAGELAKASSLATEQNLRTITDVLTSNQKMYVGDLFYGMFWDIDEEPADITFSTIDKWIFIPQEYGESVNHNKYVRGYFHFYKWYKRRGIMYKKIRIDVYDGSFISSIERYLQGSMDFRKIPENILCINLAKLFILRIPSGFKVKNYNALAVFCIAKDANENNIIYYEGWDPQKRKEQILRNIQK
jgi:HKD family nuclease